MQATAKWVEGFQSVVDNGRNHSVVLDLPEAKNGSDMGATALELTLMSLAGCVSTIFAVVAGNSKVEFSGVKVVIEDKSPPGAKSISATAVTVYVKSEELDEKLQKILDKTMSACPVGVIFEGAGVSMETKLVREA